MPPSHSWRSTSWKPEFVWIEVQPNQQRNNERDDGGPQGRPADGALGNGILTAGNQDEGNADERARR